MGIEPRITAPTLKVLRAFMTRPDDGLSGADIGRQTKLGSGTLYPILLRLEQAGWLDSHWEDETPQVLERPRRRFYRLTGLGAKKAKSAFLEVTGIGELAWQRS
jgi:DNA-binding PadR family transcriptional regulator